MLRTHNCGELRKSDIGKEVMLCGWVQSTRDHGGIIFVDLRDRYGITQLVFNPEHNKILYEEAKKLSRECVIKATGHVIARKKGMENKALATGEVEVLVDALEVLNYSEMPPFEISERAKISEEIRLKYRYLDLRRANLQRNLILRHKVALAAREYFDSKDFIEIETPILSIHTPEGAREFLVPSRLHLGKFYSLPQSPQLYKQICMVAGLDRYFQIARCLRDEDLRADRQPEFTQIDVEMSFVTREDVLETIEGLIKHIFKKVLNIELKPFKKLTWREALSRFGSDKPDLRFGFELVDVSSIAAAHFKSESVFVLNLGKTKIKTLPPGVKAGKVKDKTIVGLEFLPKAAQAQIVDKIKASTNDYLIFSSGKFPECAQKLGELRKEIGKKLKLQGWQFVWIIDCPMFELVQGAVQPSHHIFTSPLREDLHLLESEPLKVRANQYDLVLNGWEIGSGSIRINKKELQERVLNIIGHSYEEIEKKFGFLLNAFKYGAPPHGGIALGLDRLVALMCGTNDIREVIAFPKNKAAQGVMEGSPSAASENELKLLGLSIVK